MPHRHLRAASGAFVLAVAASAACADPNIQTIDTTSLATIEYDAITKGAGPIPFSNFGVQASAGLGSGASASVQGQTTFTFPTIAAGQTFTANSSALDYAYAPSWTGGSIGVHSGLSIDTNFVYDIGPFSGNDSIFSAALNASSSGNIGGGGTLSGSAASSGVVVGPSYNFGLTESAVVASASVGVTVGVNLQNAVTYTPTLEYGYYTWINTTGTLSAADTPVWHSVASGNLTYGFAANLATVAGSEDFFLNFLPGVRMDLQISPTATVTVPLTGYLSAEAFGDTLADATLSLGNLYSYEAIFDTWDDDVDWNGKGYYSLDLHEDNSSCQIHPGPTCEVYDVIGDPQLYAQTHFPSDTTQDQTGGGGDAFWNPSVTNPPLLPSACDPTTGICYASNDPNMPVGPGTVTITDTQVGVPESGSAALLAAALVMLGGLRLGGLRRRARTALPAHHL